MPCDLPFVVIALGGSVRGRSCSPCQGERWTFFDVVCRSGSGCLLRQAVGRCAGLLVDRFSGLCFFSFSRARFFALLFFLARAVSAFLFRFFVLLLLSAL